MKSLPFYRKGQSKQDFLTEFESSAAAREQFPTKKARNAEALKRYGAKRVKAAFVVGAKKEEYLYAKHVIKLSPELSEKTKKLPESGPGYHVVVACFGETKVPGIVHNGLEFETDEELPVGEITDILKND